MGNINLSSIKCERCGRSMVDSPESAWSSDQGVRGAGRSQTRSVFKLEITICYVMFVMLCYVWLDFSRLG
jgi:hypothetical protein